MACEALRNGPEPFAERRSALLLCGSPVLKCLKPCSLLGCCCGCLASKVLGGALCLA